MPHKAVAHNCPKHLRNRLIKGKRIGQKGTEVKKERDKKLIIVEFTHRERYRSKVDYSTLHLVSFRRTVSGKYSSHSFTAKEDQCV